MPRPPFNDNAFESLKKVTLVDDGRFGLEGEIVVQSFNSPIVGDDCDHLITHRLACTLQSNNAHALGHEQKNV